jgi:predicted DNA-binding protein
MKQEKVVISIRVEREVKERLQEWAKAEYRSLGSYMESIVAREVARRESGVVTLESLESLLLSLLEKYEAKNKKVSRARNPKELELFDGLSESSWLAWLEHRRVLGAPLSYGEGERTVDQLKGWDTEGYNVNAIIDDCIKAISRKLYLPRAALYSVNGKR